MLIQRLWCGPNAIRVFLRPRSGSRENQKGSAKVVEVAEEADEGVEEETEV